MIDQMNRGIPVRAYRRAGWASLAVLALTTVHHIDGAILYDTPWRLHVAIVAPIIGAAIIGSLYLGGTRRGTRIGARWTMVAAILILVVPVGLIGLVEGGYNHLVKNMVYFSSGAGTARALFPSPAYELPDDVLFEASGIAQFPLGMIAAWCAFALHPFGRGRIA